MRLAVTALVASLLAAAMPAPGYGYAATDDYCMADDPNPFANFGVRAPYDAAGPRLDPSAAKLPGCSPVQLWFIGRHGTRHGRSADIELILRLPKLQGRISGNKGAGRTVGLCAADLENILLWQPGVDKSMSYQLTPQGQQDQLHLGQRFRARYPELFGSQSAANFKFMYDDSERCIQSSHWFFKGIYDRDPTAGEGSIDSLPDFYNKCPAYLTHIATDFVFGDFNKFKKGAEFSAMIQSVSSRLGFYQNLDVDDIEGMYTACSFERARNWDSGAKSSPWCAVFRPKDFEVLEYWYDMKEYYRTGYGHKVHAKLGCVPIKDLVRTFVTRATTGGSGSPPSGIIYHSHDTLLNMVVAFFGLHRDYIEMRETTFAQLRDRQWRVTNFSPFASNLHAVLHECSGQDRYRVQMFLNEKLLPLADWGCDPESCTWSQFMAKFGHVDRDCKKKRLCWGI